MNGSRVTTGVSGRMALYADDMPSRVLIADDHAGFRAQARMLLEAFGYDVVGEAEDGGTAIAAVHALHPDVLLLDIQLPDRDGFSVADEIAGEADAPQVVLISSREASDYAPRLSQVPVAGFIHKPELSRARLEELVGSPG